MQTTQTAYFSAYRSLNLNRDAQGAGRCRSQRRTTLAPAPNGSPCSGVLSHPVARAVEIWAALRSLGTHGVADLIDRTCRHATAFAEGLCAAGYEVLNDVVLNQVLVSFGDDEVTARIIDAIQAEGTCWCGGTLWKGRKAMRISVSSWATTESDVERSLKAMLAIAAIESQCSVL